MIRAHAPGQKNLTDGVVNLVRAGMKQVLSLQIDLRATESPSKSLSQVERCGPATKLP